ncbi:putative transcription factor C2H2 family [Rosa chinensis]|uniref:Putative transcription factor C2H2 family n=1 Tax=Rosa chinensis TaxID=74649 RepID=A0A2P6RTQ9_ROSCH|nr:uncharacterized protein LOC112187390 [Rosa chinensis]PRQ49816.1 putative transcription factor C2H2 family [Rosa chinensis]
MAGRWDLGLPKAKACSLREQATRTILRNVRSQGHTYVEVREDGKKFIFFCTLCLAPCYSDKVLFDHLKGNLHNERLAAAKVTLLRPNPWPFNDGVVFFDNSYETDRVLVTPDDNKFRLLESHDNENNLAIVKYGDNLNTNGYDHCGVDERECNEYIDSPGLHSNVGVKSFVENSTADGAISSVVIPGVVVRDEITDIEVREVGLGEIAARFHGKDGISRIWCEWLGVKSLDSENFCKVTEHDFAVVTFSYNIDLGRKGLLDDVRMLLSSSPTIESGNGEGTGCKRKKSFSDPEDISDSLSNQYDSFGEDSSASSGPASRLLLDHYDDQLPSLNTRFILNKSIRRELRRQQRLASGRMCDICQQRMLPGKDVATLMNVKTGRLACSSRNVNGAFHVFHTSCLIHWILLCEVEIITNQNTGSKVRRRSRRKTAAKCNGTDAQLKSMTPQIYSVFCPECQGTGIVVDGDELEKPNLPLSQMFTYKIKVSDARRAWMKSPEMLQNCSTGFHFPSQSEAGIQEKVKTLKLLHFYRAHE